MDFQVLVQAFDQAVVGVGQFAVAGKTSGRVVAENRREAWVFVDFEASAKGVGAQAIDRQRHQPFAVQAQQGGRIAGQQAAHGVEQASVALALGQVAGQVADQRQQGGKQWFCGHKDSSWSN
ncbi:hypothetical protein D3C78_1525470 [compost metagenome]